MSLDTAKDNEDLQKAVQLLEFQSLTSRITNTIGKPVELGLKALPAPIMNKVGDLTDLCLKVALKAVLLTVNKKKRFKKSKNFLHKGLVATTGATGGFFGGVALAIELPLSTSIMMRSIAEIAREKGEDLTKTEACLECIAVLGLDPASSRSQVTIEEKGKYFIARNSMAREIERAAEYITTNGLSEKSAPIVVKILRKVAESFGVQLTEKVAAEIIPVVGAVSGGVINTLFISHFQQMATGHFTIRYLNRKYGEGRVRLEYERILRRLKKLPDIDLDEAAATIEN